MHDLKSHDLVIIGGGLAGSEAAWQAATRGLRVQLYEMRPVRRTPAHQTAWLAELVCSNSLKSAAPDTAPGLLKEELRRLGSLVLCMADAARIPAGSALAVDREQFARSISEALLSHPDITVVREEIHEIAPELPTIVATGPLTSERLSEQIRQLSGERHLYFHDAISPIVDAETIDYSKAFFASRHGESDAADYLNCPLTKEEYLRFHEALTHATVVPFHAFEEPRYFEACLPVEEIARRGVDALAYGPMRPVGLVDGQGRGDFYAVVQLRRENLMASAFNLVGFQTKLTYPEQKRVLRLIPALERAEFLRYGSLHRNTYINSPKLLRDTLQFRGRDALFFAGQITGVEGYTESVATGLLAGLNAVRLIQGADLLIPPPSTALGALVRYIAYSTAEPFQPMNINFGLLPELPHRVRGKGERRRQMVQLALTAADQWRAASGAMLGV
ncbi:MAG TPA: methylenetetrahydrofolate--tRNA-(uracil(54)-C(5))-methyltransferase (FADH(2)-oxidizing) TrmFO [Candidatus Tectomicrobia bacterium]|nr:methylenetetrahydrofolate--tRNA-(uracil(54)-C(5))-methyltransferase (FADH(2)-oxidizing) TrmFO [Candidatus Tectomicrobia bacterium]